LDKNLVHLSNKIKKTIVMNIGNNLRVIRSKKNISQQEVADFLGVDRKTYMNWEMSVSAVKSSYIPKLAEFFDIEINDLFQEKSVDIIINQQNSDNKDTSINNSIVLLLNDKEAVDQLMEVMKKRFERQ
jgi:transcriptional regulator with XRE-family HTH domain